MRNLVLALLLFSSAAHAANSFPPCNAIYINEVWQAQDGTFWYCKGASWIGISASLDGGIIGGDLTVYGDAGVSKNVSIGGTINAQDAGFRNVTVLGDTSGYDAGWLNISAVDGGFQRVAASQDVQVAGQLVPTQHGATQLAIESGMDAGTNGALTVAFGTAFAAAPVCFCNHLNATNTSPCNINNTVPPTTALGSFMVDAGGTDKISWLCVGSK